MTYKTMYNCIVLDTTRMVEFFNVHIKKTEINRYFLMRFYKKKRKIIQNVKIIVI